MTSPYLGEIRMFGGAFEPISWAFCSGQLCQIDWYPELFQLFGAVFGGDGVTTFCFPDLRGRVPIHQGLGVQFGDVGGAETVQLTPDELPAHTHAVQAAGTATTPSPANAIWAENPNAATAPYRKDKADSGMAVAAVSETGGGQGHENMQPFVVMNYIIALVTGADDSTAPFIGEIRAFATTALPPGWVPCDGRALLVQQNPTFFSIIGNYFGGDGVKSFCVPNMAGAVPIHAGQGNGLTNRILGQSGGVTTVTLTSDQLPAHTHTAVCSSSVGDAYSPGAGYWAADAGGGASYVASGATTQMAAGAFGKTGGTEAHDNMQPYLAITYAIASEGVYPQRG